MRFPRLDARDLDDRPVTLPDDLGSDPTLLVVSFTPRLGPDVETWLSFATALDTDTATATATDAGVDLWCYDLLVLPELPEGVRASLTDELRSDLDARASVRSLVAHTDLASFRRTLMLDRPDRVYALLLVDGRVRWRAFGPLTTALERSLRSTLSAGLDDPSDDLVAS
jgi:hypothetical protein